MKYQLLSGWPVGQFLIPAGTIIEASKDGRANWQGHPLPLPPPPSTALALDQGAYDALGVAYRGHESEFHFDRAVVKPKLPR